MAAANDRRDGANEKKQDRASLLDMLRMTEEETGETLICSMPESRTCLYEIEVAVRRGHAIAELISAIENAIHTMRQEGLTDSDIVRELEKRSIPHPETLME